METAMESIEQLAKEYAAARDLLADRIQREKNLVERIHRRYLPGIKSAVRAAKDARGALHREIEAHPEEFAKPKTRIIHGTKVGYAKQRGRLEWSDKDAVVKLVKKHFPESVEVLISTTETPNKAALAELPASDLRRIGVSVTDDTDAVVIKSVDTEIEKLVKALLESDKEEQV